MKKFAKILKNPLFYIMNFVFLNWILLFQITKLAPPDFYKYYFAGEKLIKGNLKVSFIPPLFPLSILTVGKIITPFVKFLNPYITSGKLFSLLAGAGISFFSYKILKNFTNNFSLLGTLFIIISPFFLQFLCFPVTDFIYLFFVVSTFYFFIKGKRTLSLLTIVLGMLTRFEGILLLFAYFIRFFVFKKKDYLKYFFVVLTTFPLLYLFYYKFGFRFIKKIILVFSTKSFLFFFYHPEHLMYILHSGIMAFIPARSPSFVHNTLFFSLIIFFFWGAFFIFKREFRFSLSLLFYEVSFALGKGYVFANSFTILPGEHNLRRFLSFVFLFYIISFVGWYAFLKYIKDKLNKEVFLYLRFTFYPLAFIFVFYKYLFSGTILFLSSLFLLPVILLFVKRIQLKSIEKAIIVFLFFAFFSGFYLKSYKKAYKYTASTPNKGAFMIAKWINEEGERLKVKRIVVLSSLPIVRFYLKRKVTLIRFYPREEKFYKTEKNLKSFLIKHLKNSKVKFLAFEWYLNPLDRPGETALKNFLFKIGRDNEDFLLEKNLIFENKLVGRIMRIKNKSFQKKSHFVL